MSPTVLLVEDEVELVRVLRDYLERAGFRVQTASTGPEAVSRFQHTPPDLVLLDLNLPGLDGLDVARAMRRDSNVPIIMVTARVDEADRLVGLELGADDYIVKPFSPKELVARVRAVLRRAGQAPDAPAVLHAGDVAIDLTRHQVEVAGRKVDLTPSEFDLLAALVREPGRVFTPPAAAGSLPGRRLHRLRAHGRRPHQEPAGEDRARPAPPALRPDRLRRRLPVLR